MKASLKTRHSTTAFLDGQVRWDGSQDEMLQSDQHHKLLLTTLEVSAPQFLVQHLYK